MIHPNLSLQHRRPEEVRPAGNGGLGANTLLQSREPGYPFLHPLLGESQPDAECEQNSAQRTIKPDRRFWIAPEEAC